MYNHSYHTLSICQTQNYITGKELYLHTSCQIHCHKNLFMRFSWMLSLNDWLVLNLIDILPHFTLKHRIWKINICAWTYTWMVTNLSQNTNSSDGLQMFKSHIWLCPSTHNHAILMSKIVIFRKEQFRYLMLLNNTSRLNPSDIGLKDNRNDISL